MWYFLSKGPDPQRGGSVYTAIWYNQRTHTCVNINQFIRYARISGQRHNVSPPKIISTMKRHGYTSHSDNEWTPTYTGGNRTMVAAATIVSMAAAKKARQNVFALYHSYNRTILLGFICILDFHFKIVLVLRQRYLIPMRCNNGKRKMWP